MTPFAATITTQSDRTLRSALHHPATSDAERAVIVAELRARETGRCGVVLQFRPRVVVP